MGDRLHISTTLTYYKRPEVREAIVEAADNREIAVAFRDGKFGKRPDTIKYTGDVLEFAKQGVVAFHCSEELWENPLQLATTLKKRDLDNLRIGWDLVLDVDCEFLEYSKAATELIAEALKHHDVDNYSVKFSGNTGFHITLPFISFPNRIYNRETKDLFPDGPRRIALYLKQMISSPLADKILAMDRIEKIMKKTKKPYSELVKNQEFNPFSILNIDTVLISSRHLYRMPYSLNEKAGLVSVPIKSSKIKDFEREEAKPDNVSVDLKFLNYAKENEAKRLILNAFDFVKEEEKVKIEGEFLGSPTAVQERFFPPCIKKTLGGLNDGKKRSVFILINFLTSVGWKYDDIEILLREWNKKNNEPLKEVYLLGQLKYHKRLSKKIPPPNCKKRYEEIGVCHPDNFCSKIKNPANYAIKKSKMLFEEKTTSG